MDSYWFVGIACSVAGGLIVLVGGWLYREVFPKFLQRFYHHEPSIDGKWKTTFQEQGKEYHETTTIKQKGRKINGTIVLTENELTTTYEFEGKFKYLILTATYESTNPEDYEQGSFALRYKRNMLDGQYILFARESEELITSNYKWTRV